MKTYLGMIIFLYTGRTTSFKCWVLPNTLAIIKAFLPLQVPINRKRKEGREEEGLIGLLFPSSLGSFGTVLLGQPPLHCLHPGVGEGGTGMILARAGVSCIPLQVAMKPSTFFANLLLTAAMPTCTHACVHTHFVWPLSEVSSPLTARVKTHCARAS